MNYTKNYRLPQWVKEDRIMMDDFNAAMSSMESGMTRTDAKADTAISTANAAKQTADAAANAKPYVVGHYTGTGVDQEINVGFRPSFLIISGMGDTTIVNSDLSWTPYFALTGGHVLTNRVGFTDTGFTVYDRNHGGGLYPDFTDKGRGYDYIAFK